MNHLTHSLLLFLAVTFTAANWTYLAIGLAAFALINTFFIRWVLKQIRVEPDLDADDLANAGASNAIGESAATTTIRPTVGVPRSRSLRPRDPQAEAAEAAASTRTGMPELASVASASAGPGEMRPGDELSSRPGKLASYEPLIPFSPAAAADNPLPSAARSITPEPAGSLMELVTAAPAAPVVPPPAESLSVPSLTGSEPPKPPAESVAKVTFPKPVKAEEKPILVPPPVTPAVSGAPSLPDLFKGQPAPMPDPIKIPAVPSNPQPDAKSQLIEMPPSPEPDLKVDPDDVKKTKSPKSSATTSPEPLEPAASIEASPVEKPSPAMTGLILPDLIPIQKAEPANKKATVEKSPEPSAKTAPVEEIPVPAAKTPEPPAPAAPIVPEPAAAPAPAAETPVPPPAPEPVAPAPAAETPAPVAPVTPESSAPAPVAEKPAKAAGKPGGRGRVFLPSIFGKSADKTPTPPAETPAPEPIVPASAVPLTAVAAPVEATPAAAPVEPTPAPIPEPPKLEVPAASEDKPSSRSEDERLEILRSIVAKAKPEPAAPEGASSFTTPPAPSAEEDWGYLMAIPAENEKAPSAEPMPVEASHPTPALSAAVEKAPEAAHHPVDEPVTPAVSTPVESIITKPDPNPGLSPVDAGHIHGASVEAPAAPAPESQPAATEPVELHDIPLLATEPPPLPTHEGTAHGLTAEVSSERVDTAPVLPQTPVPAAEPAAEAPLVPAATVAPVLPASEASPTTSQKAAAPAEVASTTTPRSTMPTTDNTSAPGARASAQLTLGFEVTSLQLTPFFKLGAVQLRPLSNVVSLHLITTEQAENPLAAGISFQIDTVDLDENAHVKSILLKPLGQAQAATVPQPKLQVENVQVGQAAEGPIQVTSSQGTSTAVQLLATCTIAAMDFTPAFEIGSLRLEPTSNTVLLRSAPSQRPAALDLPPSFEVANVVLEGAAQIASVRLTPSVGK